MLDSIYHMKLKLHKITFWRENVKILLHFSNVIMDVITVTLLNL